MRNLFILIFVGLIALGCEPQRDANTIRQEIKDKKSSITAIQTEISELEIELDKYTDGNTFTGKKTPVRIAMAEKKKFNHFFKATGEVESTNEAFISPEVNGQIVDIKVKEGQKVKKGQVLAKLNTSLIEKNMVELKTQLDFAETMFEKQSDLWQRNIGSERQYLEAKNNYENLQNKLHTLKTQYDLSIIKAPFAGVVEDILSKEGELAGPGMMLMQIVDLDKLLIKAKLSESYLSAINIGDEVSITFPSYPELKMTAVVARTGNVINKQNRTFLVELNINNKNNVLKPNMLANIMFNDYTGNDNFIVPSILIKKDLNGKYLYVTGKKDDLVVSVKKYVETGRTYKDQTEVIDGIEQGEYLITDGYNNVSDGGVLNIIK